MNKGFQAANEFIGPLSSPIIFLLTFNFTSQIIYFIIKQGYHSLKIPYKITSGNVCTLATLLWGVLNIH